MRLVIMKTFWLAVFAVCFTAAVCNAVNMHREWENGAVCSIETSNSDDLALLTALYPELEWTAYDQRFDPLTVTNDASAAHAMQVQGLAFLGDPDRIAFFPLVSGRLPYEGESEVCALDVDTAFAIFRNTSAEGNRVRVNGTTLLVVGVINVERPLLMLPAAQDAHFDRLAADNREELSMLVSALGGEIDPFEFSGTEAARASILLCVVPCVYLIAFALGALQRYGGWCKYLSVILRSALFAGIVLLVLWCIPVRLLPARWSDLDFYAKQLDTFRTRPVRLSDARDLLIQSDIVRVGILNLLSCAALWMERKCLKCERPS